MARVVVLGAGISGHTAASHIRRKLDRDHEVIVINPSEYYQWESYYLLFHKFAQ